MSMLPQSTHYEFNFWPSLNPCQQKKGQKLDEEIARMENNIESTEVKKKCIKIKDKTVAQARIQETNPYAYISRD